MTHVIQGGWAAAQGPLLAQMYQERKRVFIDLLRWDLPALDGRYEIDQFDTPSTIYLIIADTDGKHLGSLRLLPTTQPHVLGDIFPGLCDLDSPRSPDVWEISRLCLSRGIRAAERRIVRDKLATALTLFARDNGIRAYCCVADMPWYTQILSFGWRCEPLGLPQDLPCGMLAALMIHIDDETPRLLGKTGIWSEALAPLVALSQ
ncbi:acyl-homoserine-lactone synthase [Novosphingobium malaysiense]|uniref:Acyl-homoserine-lactone synthase n=1 Tax=Novosphingobium malaysiense TaxID=1348853 RepID=A0A0B1ZFC7_9SPHN|nr:acyl-homoserine-lactone synthase [Novosphingobium malaysiense]KHK89195.1 autoinducer synthase [Novosphingobium malaysiense]